MESLEGRESRPSKDFKMNKKFFVWFSLPPLVGMYLSV